MSELHFTEGGSGGQRGSMTPARSCVTSTVLQQGLGTNGPQGKEVIGLHRNEDFLNLEGI